MSERKEPPFVVNFDDLDVKRRVVQRIGKLKGLWELSLKPRKLTRSLDANAFYFAACVGPFRDWLVENWGESVTTEQAHETLKLALLDVPRVGGIAIMPSSKNMDSGEFSAYVEKVIEFLATKCDIVVLDSELFYETKGSK